MRDGYSRERWSELFNSCCQVLCCYQLLSYCQLLFVYLTWRTKSALCKTRDKARYFKKVGALGLSSSSYSPMDKPLGRWTPKSLALNLSATSQCGPFLVIYWPTWCKWHSVPYIVWSWGAGQRKTLSWVAVLLLFMAGPLYLSTQHINLKKYSGTASHYPQLYIWLVVAWQVPIYIRSTSQLRQ